MPYQLLHLHLFYPQMWSIDYVQVPDEDISNSGKKPTVETHHKPMPVHHRLVKQINVSNESADSLMKSASESSLSEENTISISVEKRSEEGSSKEWHNEQQNEKEVCSDTEEPQIHAPTPVRRRRSRVHCGLRKSEGKISVKLFFMILLWEKHWEVSRNAISKILYELLIHWGI